ncbi:FXYD domain-containing ion transport regulator 3 isoform X3 [Gorilla gorilla gorilla]|uniref:FXYD domain-containing ion transport regulator n=1 Tax=Gorilla gorilla gorilla TaxID=9595 RepID=G3SIJ8_GORGO|nr:FXYD domain-containing ion transport regulator 3 isoform X3 [Gorilla gorilla gorilla]
MGRGYSGALQARGGLEEPLERGLRGPSFTQSPLHGAAAAYLSAQRDASLPAPGQRSDMQKVTLGLLVFLAGFPVLDANDLEDKNSPFYYDWHSLQVGGLICAGVLCAMGIIMVVSAKCKCKFGQKSSHHPGETPPLITPGSAQS